MSPQCLEAIKLKNCRASKVRWPHLVQCDGLVDLLIGVDYAEPIAHLGLQGWICIGPDLMVEHSLEQDQTPPKRC